jgi:hypothetical protein
VNKGRRKHFAGIAVEPPSANRISLNTVVKLVMEAVSAYITSIKDNAKTVEVAQSVLTT